MIVIERTAVMNLENALRGARNPMNSWARSDSGFDENGNYVPKAAEPAPSQAAAEPEAPAPQAVIPSGESEEARVDKILNTGSFEPVIPKSTLNDLQFGKNN